MSLTTNTQGPQGDQPGCAVRLHWQRREHDRAEGRGHGQGTLGVFAFVLGWGDGMSDIVDRDRQFAEAIKEEPDFFLLVGWVDLGFTLTGVMRS